MRLGVNIDHIATLRQQRTEGYPSLIDAARLALDSGADLITIHLREDRRHIQKADVYEIRKVCPVLNLEMALSDEMLDIAKEVRPDWICLVPEKRSELTTEGGLNIRKYQKSIEQSLSQLHKMNIKCSLFIEADIDAIEVAKALKVDAIELHTGSYANALDKSLELNRIQKAVQFAERLNLQVHAGHGLNLDNISEIAKIKSIQELNIGHSIIARAIFVGLREAIQEIKNAIHQAAS